MEYYEVIKDEQSLREFIDWLPELQVNEVFYLSLFARKKYCPELVQSNDKTQLKRFTSDKSRMIHKIRQLEIGLGKWVLSDRSAPQSSLVLYITPNPRNMQKATAAMGKRCWELFRSNNFNLHAEAMSCIQNAKSRTVYVDFDIDNKDLNVYQLKQLCQGMVGDNFTIVETRGGYHVLVNPVGASKYAKELSENIGIKSVANWYKEMQSTLDVDKDAKPQLLPVPGTVQGDFIPKLIKP